ncbi:MAG: hypothetical protein QG622_1769 [Actinomycetota bacterium]|nr:hypothetical protein [Actinomycetota bacterium]
MGTPAASTAGQSRPGPKDDVERLGRRDLLVLKLELLRGRRSGGAQTPANGQRVTRKTR